MPPHKGQKGNWKGRSGRRSLTDEVERARIRQLAWTTTGQYLESNASLQQRTDRALKIVTADMAKPVLIDNSQHTHLTTIQVDKLEPEKLMEYVINGRLDAQQSTR